ncbi:MAG: helix-turn-helix transcriptional regulator [Streptosporangiaceae bacterium]
MPDFGSPTVRRRELGARLRELRTDKGWTIKQVAEQLRFSPSKVSRLENGYRGVSPRDIEDLCDLYDIQGGRRQQLISLAAEGKQRAPDQARDLPYATYAGLEADAASISDFGLGVVPGLLQTADYARAVLTAVHPRLSETEIERRLSGRIGRQDLLRSAVPPRFDAVIDEAVLHRPAGNRRIMSAQLRHLLAITQELPSVAIQVLPFQAGLLPVPNNKFIILRFREPSVPDVVFVELHTGDLYLGPEEGLADYQTAFRAMQRMAATAAASREIIETIARALED